MKNTLATVYTGHTLEILFNRLNVLISRGWCPCINDLTLQDGAKVWHVGLNRGQNEWLFKNHEGNIHEQAELFESALDAAMKRAEKIENI